MTPRIALVSRELHPFAGGGIAPSVRAISQTLAPVADVTVFTTSIHRARYDELGGAALFPGVRVLFVDEPPEGRGHYYAFAQAWSHRVFEALLEAFPGGGPDLIEFPDWLGEGFVTIQAKQACEPALRDTVLAVRTHTTAELAWLLNGQLNDELEARAIMEMERFCLRHADVLLWQGGDVLGTYQRYYGADALAPGARVTDALMLERIEAHADRPREGPLKLLYLGRLERRKGVQNLVRALQALDCDKFSLDFVGGDTETAPLGQSMHDQIEFMTIEDDRFRLQPPVPPQRVGEFIDACDAVVVPSLWECWPNVAREAMLHDRPVIATPVGGLLELVQSGESGWLARGTDVEALQAVLDPLVADPEQVRALGRSGAPRRTLEQIMDPERVRAGYLGVMEGHALAPPRRSRRAATPLVSVVVPYYQMDRFVEDTLRSVAAQTHPAVEIVIVNDGSIREEDRMLEDVGERYGARLVMQRNRGLSAARNHGIAHALGRYVLPLDPDNLIHPEYVERCLRVLEDDLDVAYVSTWSRYVDEDGEPMPGADPGYTPLGNWSTLTDDYNVAGDGTALLRRNLFDAGLSYSVDLTSFEDWMLYRRLRAAGRFGRIIPRALLTYRVRATSMLRSTGLLREKRLQGEMASLLAEGEMTWVPPRD